MATEMRNGSLGRGPSISLEPSVAHLTGSGDPKTALLVVAIGLVGIVALATATDSWLEAISLLAVVLAIGFIFSRPMVGLCALLMALPFQRIVPLNLPIGQLTLPRTIILVAMAALIVRTLILRSGRRGSLRTPFDGALLALIVAWLASSVMSIKVTPGAQIQGYLDESSLHFARHQPFIKSYTEVISYLVNVAAVYVMCSLLTSTKLIHMAIKFWITGASIACLIGLYATIGYYYQLPVPNEIANTYYLIDPDSSAEVSRIRSVTSEPRYFTYYLITVLPFLIVVGLRKQYVISRTFHLGTVVLLGLSFFLTMSRSMILLGLAMIVLVPMISTWGGSTSKLSRRNSIGILGRAVVVVTLLLGLAGMLLLGVGGLNFGSALVELTGTIDPSDRSIGAQMINNVIAINLFLENPILGVGIGNFAFSAGPLAVPSWSPLDHDANDTVVFVTSVYLQTLSEVGIVGGVALLYLFSTIGLSAIRTIRASGDERWAATMAGFTGSFVMIALAVLFIPNFFSPETWVVLGFIATVSRHVASSQRMSTINQPECRLQYSKR